MVFTQCLVCSDVVAPVAFRIGSLGQFDCRVCGSYRTTRETADDGITEHAVPKGMRHLLQAWIKRQGLLGAEPPTLTEGGCAVIVREAPTLTPTEKMEQLLFACGILCGRPGRMFRANAATDYPYASALDQAEYNDYWGWLHNLKYVYGPETGCTLSREGWARFSELQAAEPGTGRKVFVAMWFDGKLDAAWEHGLAPAIEDVGLEPQRLKEEIHADRIDARIVAAIRACRFLVADVTGARPAVYYEAGLAEGLKKSVVWTCRRDDEKSMCFDTRQYRHILWDDPEHLRQELVATIKARAL